MIKHQHHDFQSDVFLLLETVGAYLTICKAINTFMSHITHNITLVFTMGARRAHETLQLGFETTSTNFRLKGKWYLIMTGCYPIIDNTP